MSKRIIFRIKDRGTMKRHSLIKRLKERMHIRAFINKGIGHVSSISLKIWRFVQRVINVNTISLLIAAIAAYRHSPEGVYGRV